jgi:hypothetical protein
MMGIGRRAAAIGAVTALLAGVGVGAASAAPGHHQATKSATTKSKSATKTRTSTSAKARRDERELRAMTVRERRGPGSPREERTESRALQRKELRNHAEVKRTTAKGTSPHKSAPKTAGTTKMH